MVGSSIAGHAEGKIIELENMPTETHQQNGQEKKAGSRRRSMTLGTISKGVTHAKWKSQKEKKEKAEWEKYLKYYWPRILQN